MLLCMNESLDHKCHLCGKTVGEITQKSRGQRNAASSIVVGAAPTAPPLHGGQRSGAPSWSLWCQPLLRLRGLSARPQRDQSSGRHVVCVGGRKLTAH